ncbi:MAG: hypothetical protein IJ333_05085 [Clostridia bacterium]|nr:hypothetical protein [Clostridia bacterium]
MSVIDKFKELVAYQPKEEEQAAVQQIIEYIEQKYVVHVYKCVLTYENIKEVRFVEIYLMKNAEWDKIISPPGTGRWLHEFPEDGKRFSEILKHKGFKINSHLQDGLFVFFYSFEEISLDACYSTSVLGGKFKKFKERYFNPATMECIDTSAMFVVYKTKELMEAAEKSGEQAKIKEDYYNFIKEYDTFDLVTRDKNLLVHFDYMGHARNPRAYYDLYYDMIREP